MVAGHPHVRLQMRSFTVALLAHLLAASGVCAKDLPFTGEWEIDLLDRGARASGIECGNAGFRLRQSGQGVSGDHWQTSANCGRLNEGCEGSVVGSVRGRKAILTVTSCRNGQVVRGRATLEGRNLRWKVLKELKSVPDEGLILQQGLLQRVGG